MNFLLGVAVLVGSVVLGFAISCGYKKSHSLLDDFYKFLEYLEGNCAFLQDSVKKILSTKRGAYGSDFNELLQGLATNLDDKERFLGEWQAKQKLVTSEQAQFIVEFFMQLGRLDCDSQITAIKNAKSNFLVHLQKSMQKTTEKSLLSTKLGVICGIALFIIVL